LSERTNVLVCLACVISFLFSAAHAGDGTQTEGSKIDCAKLSSQLDPDQLTGDYRESPLAALPAPISRANPSSMNGLTQLRQDGKLKLLEPTLTPDEVFHCFGTQAREILWLRNSLINQRGRFRKIKDLNNSCLFWTQVTTIALGAVATILLGLGTNARWSALKNIAIIPTALVTAISTFSAFVDYRGSVVRAAKAESDLSTLMTNIDKELLKVVAQGKFSVDRDILDKWWKDADASIKGVDEDWLAHFSQRDARS
jgi:hypothetical protein